MYYLVCKGLLLLPNDGVGVARGKGHRVSGDTAGISFPNQRFRSRKAEAGYLRTTPTNQPTTQRCIQRRKIPTKIQPNNHRTNQTNQATNQKTHLRHHRLRRDGGPGVDLRAALARSPRRRGNRVRPKRADRHHLRPHEILRLVHLRLAEVGRTRGAETKQQKVAAGRKKARHIIWHAREGARRRAGSWSHVQRQPHPPRRL